MFSDENFHLHVYSTAQILLELLIKFHFDIILSLNGNVVLVMAGGCVFHTRLRQIGWDSSSPHVGVSVLWSVQAVAFIMTVNKKVLRQ